MTYRKGKKFPFSEGKSFTFVDKKISSQEKAQNKEINFLKLWEESHHVVALYRNIENLFLYVWGTWAWKCWCSNMCIKLFFSFFISIFITSNDKVKNPENIELAGVQSEPQCISLIITIWISILEYYMTFTQLFTYQVSYRYRKIWILIFEIFVFKGTVARDFWPLFFFHKLIPYGSLNHTLKYFRIRFRIRGDIHIRR
jgi:hypothetical protein